MTPISTINTSIAPAYPGIAKRYQHAHLVGFFLHLLGLAFKVEDEATKRSFYMTKRGLVIAMTAHQSIPMRKVALKSSRAAQRALETLNPVMGEPTKVSQIRDVAGEIAPLRTKKALIETLETIRDRHLPHLPLDRAQLTDVLKPGDIILKKYHEDNTNLICTLQKLFQPLTRGKKVRESYKFSHAAMYVGNGEVAEAVMPRGGDPEVRVLGLDHRCFALLPKNQYWVARPKNAALGAQAAEVFRSFATPMQEQNPEKPSLKYNFIEALRSLWHFSSFGYFAKQRMLKYYADHLDAVAPTQIVLPRQLFCSYAVAMTYQAADGVVRRPQNMGSLRQIVGDPPTKVGNKVLRAIVRGIWSRYHAIVHRKELDDFVQMKYDALRTSPQDLRNYILHNPQQFQMRLIIDSSSSSLS